MSIHYDWALFLRFIVMPQPSRAGRRMYFLLYLSICLFVLSFVVSVIKLANPIFRKRMIWLWCKLAQLVHRARTWNDQLWVSGGQKSRSHKTEERFGGLKEESFSSLDAFGSSSFLICIFITFWFNLYCRLAAVSGYWEDVKLVLPKALQMCNS